MISPSLQSRTVFKEGNKAIFEIAGLYPGYGVTVGNCLRRVLLSSLKGAAITQVKIDGISHEFSTIGGVLEDMVLLILNLKKLTFKMYSEEPQAISLSVKGEREVKGKDFRLTSELELANPEAHIATLTKPSAELKIEAVVESGVGYEVAKSRDTKKAEIGVIPLDAVYTPMKKVSFKVENMRVGKRTDFDLLRLEVETDGSIDPEEALRKSAGFLIEHFSEIAKLGQELISPKEDSVTTKKPAGKKSAAAGTKAEEGEETSKIKIDDSKLSERIKNVLLTNNVKTFGGLVRKSEDDLLKMEGLGEKAVSEIKKALKKMNLELRS